jgi:hypothetical protein
MHCTNNLDDRRHQRAAYVGSLQLRVQQEGEGKEGEESAGAGAAAGSVPGVVAGVEAGVVAGGSENAPAKLGQLEVLMAMLHPVLHPVTGLPVMLIPALQVHDTSHYTLACSRWQLQLQLT